MSEDKKPGWWAIIEEYKKKWEIKCKNLWWEEPFRRCYEEGRKHEQARITKAIEILPFEICEYCKKRTHTYCKGDVLKIVNQKEPKEGN